MNDDLLQIEKLNVEYITDDAIVYALNDFSLNVKRGEKIGLVGETGAGKTTLALSILRLLYRFYVSFLKKLEKLPQVQSPMREKNFLISLKVICLVLEEEESR